MACATSVALYMNRNSGVKSFNVPYEHGVVVLKTSKNVFCIKLIESASGFTIHRLLIGTTILLFSCVALLDRMQFKYAFIPKGDDLLTAWV